MSDNAEKMIDMYFNQKLRPVDIASVLNVSRSAVTQILKKDKRYTMEKEIRKNINKEKHIKKTKDYIKSKRKLLKDKNDSDDLILKQLHKTASIELSRMKRLSNESYREWNTSAYSYNEQKKRFEFKDNELGRSYDVPKFINGK